MIPQEFEKIKQTNPISCPKCRERWFALFDRVYIAEYGICFMCDDTIDRNMNPAEFERKTQHVSQIIKFND